MHADPGISQDRRLTVTKPAIADFGGSFEEKTATKLDLLRKAPPQYKTHFYDDLSFGQERGELQLRHQLIEKINSINRGKPMLRPDFS